VAKVTAKDFLKSLLKSQKKEALEGLNGGALTGTNQALIFICLWAQSLWMSGLPIVLPEKLWTNLHKSDIKMATKWIEKTK
jgi:hypothetical protein